MAVVPYLIAYLAIAVFGLAVLMRIVMWVKMPMHMRWELYPVAHEGKKARYGGSYLEESEWWKQPRHSSLWGELKVMIPEILFLVALKEHNFKLWIRSFPFHFGLYMVAGCTALMFGTAILFAISPEMLAGGLGRFFQITVLILGVGGLGLSLLGALGLLQRRLSAHELKDYSSSADIFNLVFFVAAFGCALLSFALVDRDLGRAMFLVSNLVTFSFVAMPGNGLEVILPTASLILLSLLVAYIPLTHMSHFIGKYFSYHAIRWNDTPNLAGGKQEPVIQKLLSQKVTWAAPHIQGQGTKTWVDVATELPAKKEKKK